MSLNSTPKGERVHIGIFGKRNAGKSSIINALTGQSVAIVSPVAGTTTDPVYKAMEMLPLGPVMIIDTPGIDDEGDLGQMRVRASYRVLNKCDIVLLVVDSNPGYTAEDLAFIETVRKKNIPLVVAFNKCDDGKREAEGVVYCSAKTGFNIDFLREEIVKKASSVFVDKPLVGDLIGEDDIILLVVPVDSAAPKGRLILPQQQTIRDILEKNAQVVVVKEDKVERAIESLRVKPKMVICDSQVFDKVNKSTPNDILMTSFSILFARYKGNLKTNVLGAKKLDELKDSDVVLISEGCSHRRQCGDIGTVKLPSWIKKHTGRDIKFEFTSGGEFPEDLSKYSLVVHCGGCMLNEKEMKYRMECASDAGVPIVNYGVAIAHMHGILKRSLEPFGDVANILE